MRRRARLWPSCRLNLALMCLAATLGFFLMRLNLSFALVCMVRQPINRPVNVTIGNATSSSRPYDLTYDDDDDQHHQQVSGDRLTLKLLTMQISAVI